MLLVIVGCGFGDRLRGAGGALRDAPLKAPEKDAALAGGLANGPFSGDLGLMVVFFGDMGGVRVFVANVRGLTGLLEDCAVGVSAVMALTRSSSLLAACVLLADCGVVGSVEEEAFPTSCGVSDRPFTVEMLSEASLTLRLAMLILSLRVVTLDDTTLTWSGIAGDWLPSRRIKSSTCCPAAVRVGADEDCTKLSFSFLLYRSFSFIVFSRSRFKPKIIARCFSTSLHSCALCEAAELFSFSSFCIAASGDPAAAMIDAASCGPEASDSR